LKGTLVRQYHSVDLQFQAGGIHAAVEGEANRGGWRTNERAHSLVREERWDSRRVVIQIQRRTNTVNVQIRCTKPEEALRTDTQGFAYLLDYLGGLRGFLHAYGPDVPPSPEWVVVQIHLGVDCRTELRLERGICVTVREAQETFRVYNKSPSFVRFELPKVTNETLVDFAKREIGFKEDFARTLGQIDSTMSDFNKRLTASEKRQLEAETSASEVAKRVASVADGVERLAKFIEADRS
jgi:hypothetical protein